MPSRREALAFLGPTYVGQLSMALLYYQVPLLVTFRFGPEAGAAFFIAWQVVTVVDVVSFRFVNSLSGQVAQHPERAVELGRLARTRVLMFVLPSLALGIVLARPMLAVFGSEYAASSTALQVLLAGAALRVIVVHALGLRQALGDVAGFVRLQVLSSLLVVAATVLVPAAADDAETLLRVGVGYLVAQALCALPLLVPRGPSSAATVRHRVLARAERGARRGA